MDFEVLQHTADLKLRVYGKEVKQLFVNAVRGMFESIGPRLEGGIKSSQERPFFVQSHDRESLLVDFLSEALYLSDVYHEAYLGVIVEEFGDFYIKGKLLGVKIKDFAEGEIKAVTHHGLKIEQQENLWVAEILFDL